MTIRLHNQYLKQYRKLPAKLQEKVIEKIGIFRTNPFHPTLRNHPLKGLLNGQRAISVTYDLRIIFEEHHDYLIVVFLDLGTHNRVY